MKKAVVILINLGGPTSPDDVQPFLNNLFRDPDIFKIPIFQKNIAKIIASKRTQKVVEEYQKIGGSSPINKWTKIQAQLLESTLKENNYNVDVIVGMRYWKPMLNEIASNDFSPYQQIILLPLYPHYSVVTTGSSINEWRRYYRGDVEIDIVYDYYNHPIYIKALNQRIDEALDQHQLASPDTYFLFSAHGIPNSFIKKGDPYQDQILETVSLIMQSRAMQNPYQVCYQSKVGPVKWLSPSTESTILKLANEGIKNMLIIPVSFVSDHLETLYEIGITYKKRALDSGVKNFVVTKGLNDSSLFIHLLKDLCEKKLKQ